MKIGVVLNPKAGFIRERGPEEMRRAIVSAFERVNLSLELICPASGDLGQRADEARRRAASGGIDAVVAAGGDGTVRTIAGLLAGSGVPFGILPLGTLNHFARDLGL